MALQKEEGGIGLRDLRILVMTTTVRKGHNIWSAEKLSWASWMRQRYIKGQMLYDIAFKKGDSPLWNDILCSREIIWHCLQCTMGNAQ